MVAISLKRLLSVCFVFVYFASNAQKYNFQHYDIAEGLSQSQVLSICQDNEKQLWISTFKGINCFNGTQFNSYSLKDGLSSNTNFGITRDNKGTIWCAGTNGISAFTASGIVNYNFGTKTNLVATTKIRCDRYNHIWVLLRKKLYRLENGKLKNQYILLVDDRISDIELDKDHNLTVFINNSGFFKLVNNHWRLFIALKDKFAFRFIFDRQHTDQIYFISGAELYRCDTGRLDSINIRTTISKDIVFYCVLQDNDGKLWIGTNKGAILIKNDSALLFNERNGFTDDRVFSLFCDVDNRVWLGTDGAGLYCYSNADFVTYDKSQGLTNDVIMAIAGDNKGHIYLGTSNNGLLSFSNNKIIQEKVLESKDPEFRINCLLAEKSGSLLIGTEVFGLWEKRLQNSRPVYSNIIKPGGFVFNYLAQDEQQVTWAATNKGCIYLENGQVKRVPSFNQYCSSITCFGKDSLFVGGTDGVYLIKNKQFDPGFRLDALHNKNVLSLKNWGRFVLIGTNDDGFFIWDSRTKKLRILDEETGLSSNTVYSIDVVKNEVWLGTEKGVNKFRITDPERFELKKEYLATPVSETNQNAIFHTDSDIWVGTTHGADVYRLTQDKPSPLVPGTVIQNIGLDVSNDVNYNYINGY